MILELYFIDHKQRTLSRFAIIDNLPALLDILQLVMDSCTCGLANVTARDPETGNHYSPAAITARYGMRKRSFLERMNNVKTYSLPEVEA